MPAVFDQNYVKRLTGTNVKTGKNKMRSGRAGSRRHSSFKKKTDRGR